MLKNLTIMTLLGCGTIAFAGDITKEIPFFVGAGVKIPCSLRWTIDITGSVLTSSYTDKMIVPSEGEVEAGHYATVIDGLCKRMWSLGRSNVRAYVGGGLWFSRHWMIMNTKEKTHTPIKRGYGVAGGGGVAYVFRSRFYADLLVTYCIPFSFIGENYTQQSFPRATLSFTYCF